MDANKDVGLGDSRVYEVDSPSSWSFHPDHQAAIDRRRRIIAQYDPTVLGLSKTIDVQAWQAFGFQYFDQPGSQVDAIWWDCDVLPGQIYSTGLLPSEGPLAKLPGTELRREPTDTGTDWLAVLLEETHKRGFEAFRNCRISGNDLGPHMAEMEHLNPIKAQRPGLGDKNVVVAGDVESDRTGSPGLQGGSGPGARRAVRF